MSYPLQFPFFQGWVATWKKRAVLLGNCIDNAVPGSGRCSGSLDAWMMPEMRIHPYLSVKCHSIMENHDEPDLEAPNLHTKPHVFYVKGNFLHLWDKPWRHMIWLWLQYCLPLPKNRMINPKKSLNVVSGAILCPSHLGKPISLGSATFPPSCAKETSRETVNSSENLCSMTHQRLNCWNLHLVRNPPKMPFFLGFMCQNRQQLHPSHLGHQTYEQHQPSALLPGGIGMGYISGGDFFGPGNFDWLVINEINPLSCTQLANPDFGWSNHQLWHCGIKSPAMTLAGHLRFRQVTAFPARSWAPGRFRKCRKRGRNPTKSRDPILNLW